MKDISENLTMKTFYVFFSVVIFISVILSINSALGLLAPPPPPCSDCVPWYMPPPTTTTNVPTSAVSYVGLSVPKNPGHSSDQIFINYSGNYVSLQTAIDKGFLYGVSPSSSDYQALPTTSPYELARQVIVTINGYNVTLKDVITHDMLNYPNYAQSYAINGIPAGDQYSGDINVINITGSQKTLQKSISSDMLQSCDPNAGALCSPSGQTCSTQGTIQCDGSCSGASGCCVSNIGSSCSITCQSCSCGITCSCSNYQLSGGTIQCDGSCGGITCPPSNPYPYTR